MKWQGREESGNVEDRRSLGKGTLAIGGGWAESWIVILALVLGVDPRGSWSSPGQDAPNGGAVEPNNQHGATP